MTYQLNKKDTVTDVSRVKNSATVDVTRTSAVVSTPYVVGQMNEVAFNTMCTNVGGSTVAAGWTGGGGTPTATVFLQPLLSVSNGPYQANGTSLIFTTPVNLDVGVYKVEYSIFCNNGQAIHAVAVNLAGGGAVTMRNFDAYLDFDVFVSMVDYFTNVTAAASCVLTWTANGKNASSSAFNVILGAPLRITKLG